MKKLNTVIKNRKIGRCLQIEKKLVVSPLTTIITTTISILLALVFGGIFLAATGHNPLEVYRLMYEGAFGTPYALSETTVKAIPLILCSLGISIAFRMLLWNIGAEGQLYMGAMGATWVALTFPDAPAIILLPLMFVAGFVCGAVWALIPAIPRAFLNVNEIITTLMLNYVAILWVEYLIYGPWKDPEGFNFPLTRQFTEGAILPTLGDSRIHFGLIIGLLAAIAIYFILHYTKWGYEIRVIGESEVAARYAGINVKRNILLAMLISGGLAGLAGMSEVSGLAHRLQPGVSIGYGYTAIIIAWLAKLNPWVIIVVSFLFGGLLVGGYALQTVGLPWATASMLQGAILFFVLGGDIFSRYKFTFRRGKEEF